MENRMTIFWEAPCFAENKKKRDDLLQLMHFVVYAPGDFLRANLDKFSKYVETA